jgi:hypothetical protein
MASVDLFCLIGDCFPIYRNPPHSALDFTFGPSNICIYYGSVVLLFFSGIGSSLARATWLPRQGAFIFLVLLALLTPLTVSQFSGYLLGLPAWGRLVLGGGTLAPLGVLMGLPFPLGLAWLEKRQQAWIPWAWAVNGCTSVIASVLAAILSLSYGFSVVLFLGASAYAGAAFLYTRMMKG